MKKHYLKVVCGILYGGLLVCLAGGAGIYAASQVPRYDLSAHIVPSMMIPPTLLERTPLIVVVSIVVLCIGTMVCAVLVWRKKSVPPRYCVAACVLILIVPVLSYTITQYYKKQEHIVRVQGFVIDPATKQQYDGIDATVGDTTLHVGQGGVVAFDAVSTKRGIALTHKDFHRRLILLPQAFATQSSTIYLSSDFFNALVSVIDSESRGKYDRIYEQLPVELKSEKVMAEYFTSYDPIFDIHDISDQEVVIASIVSKPELSMRGFSNRLHDAYEVTVYKGYRHATYVLVVDTTGIWHVVR